MPQPDAPDVLALALPSPDLDLTIAGRDVVLTAHAVRRYQERVEGVSRRLALRRLQHLVATAQWWSRPRSWTTIVLHPGVVYGYSQDRPDVCLLLRDDHVVVTVLSRRSQAAGRGRRGGSIIPVQRAAGDRACRHEADGGHAVDRRAWRVGGTARDSARITGWISAARRPWSVGRPTRAPSLPGSSRCG